MLVENTVRAKIEKFWFFFIGKCSIYELEYRSIEFKYNLQNCHNVASIEKNISANKH